MTRRDYTKAEGRRFGITLGIAFAAVSAFSLWRGHRVAAEVPGTIAAILILCAVAAPRSLRVAEQIWTRIAHLISRVTTPIFLGVVYFAVLTPAGFIRRNLGRNPLAHVARDDSYWVARDSVDAEKRRKGMERQF